MTPIRSTDSRGNDHAAVRRLPQGTLLPSVSFPALPRGEPVALRGGRGPQVLFVAHSADCPGCIGYIREVATRAREIAEWGGRLLLILPQAPEHAAALRESVSAPWRVVADPERKVPTQLGLRGASVLIADEWGEIYFAAIAGGEHELPAPAEIADWVRFISIQCPECEQPEGEWRTLQ